MADTRQRTLELAEQIAKVLHAPPQRLASETQERTLAYMEASARALGILEALPGIMATVTYSIGTSGRDFSTMTSWEAELDNGALFSAGDDAVGECYNDSAFDEDVTINGGGTLGLNSVTLTVASGERHDGTAGSGARVVASTGRQLNLRPPAGFDEKYIVEWLEWDQNGQSEASVSTSGASFGSVPSIRNMLVHDQDGGAAFNGFVAASSRDIRIANCVFYNNSRASGSTVRGLYLDADRASGGLFNTTVYNVENTSTGGCIGVTCLTNSTNTKVKNTICIDTSAGGSTSDFSFGSNADHDYNLSSDSTADGTNSITSGTASNLFVSTVAGSEDLHLKTGADAIDAGVDLGTTPSGVEVDINGRDRDSNGDTWDIGAHEFVSAGGGFNAFLASNATVVLSNA